MAGRGRGRGRGKSSIPGISEALGVRREDMPTAAEKPPPLFPPLLFQPCPLTDSEEENYRLILKQQLRAAMRTSPYYVRAATSKKDIERYSDKYCSKERGISDNHLDWQPDWRLFPKELKMRVRMKVTTGSKRQAVCAKPKLVARDKTEKQNDDKDDVDGKTEATIDVNKQLEELEKQETSASENEKKEENNPEEVDEENDYIEEEVEEENDYNLTYFDNGEDYIGFEDDDGLDDGGAYY